MRPNRRRDRPCFACLSLPVRPSGGCRRSVVSGCRGAAVGVADAPAKTGQRANQGGATGTLAPAGCAHAGPGETCKGGRPPNGRALPGRHRHQGGKPFGVRQALLRLHRQFSAPLSPRGEKHFRPHTPLPAAAQQSADFEEIERPRLPLVSFRARDLRRRPWHGARRK